MDTVLFESNSATDHGGAIWHCPLGTAHYYTYSGMMFWNNSAANEGADMYLSKAKAGLENGGEYVSEKPMRAISTDGAMTPKRTDTTPQTP